MILFPAIDLIGGQAVRLLNGRYDQMTVYDTDPLQTARRFVECGAQAVHLVDLEGARSGDMPNCDTVVQIKRETGLYCEVGGGIRSMDAVDWYISHGIDRVILGTAAVQNPDFVCEAVSKYPGKIAAGADIRNGMISVKGWTEDSDLPLAEFIKSMQKIGIDAFIVTNIAKDGAMQGTDLALYKTLQHDFNCQITASGGVSTLEDVKALRAMDLYAAIIGKAYYNGSIVLQEALEAAR